MANRRKFTNRARKRFLLVLSEQANVSAACRAVGISNRCAYDHKNDDPEFAKMWADAVEVAVDKLEQEAWHRATHGVEKPIVHKGEVVGIVREPSDRLTELLLKAHRPEKYRDRVELTGKDGKPVDLNFQVNLVPVGPAPSRLEDKSGDLEAIEAQPAKDEEAA